VTIDIQRKTGGGVAQITLYGFDIVTGADGGNGIGMSQVVKSGVRTADLSGGPLEGAVNGPGMQVIA